MQGIFENLAGQTFGKLEVISFAGRKKSGNQYKTMWLCKCECGTEKVIWAGSLKNKTSKSCGCLCKDNHYYKHRLTDTRIYRIFCAMKNRCYNLNDENYKYWGGRGIGIEEEIWLDKSKGAMDFYNWSMNNGYADNLTIDRIDNNKGYSKENCRWATKKEQNNNKSSNRLITYEGHTLNLSQWAEKLNVDYYTLKKRIYTYKWDDIKALKTPIRKINKRNVQ